MMPQKVFSLILFFFLLSYSSFAQNWDWHISNATVVDGTGAASYRADILVRGDSIGYIGEVNPDTISVHHYLDASGKVVAPGFIDVHAHGNPLNTPSFRNFLAMGVTTIVLGQDGSSPHVGRLDEWFKKVQKAGPAVNVAAFSGHGSIRGRAGVGQQPPTSTDLERMTQLLESDLSDGAFGMSTGLEYVPGLYAQKEELRHLAKVVGEHGGMIMSHMRSEDDSQIQASLKELASQGKYAPVHASHLKVVYGKGADRAEEILDYIRGFRAQDIKYTADVYPYKASYTGIGIVFPKWAKTQAGWQQAVRERPEILREYLQDKVAQRNGPGAILFGSGPYAGQTLRQAADREGVTPIDLLLDIGPQGASAAHFVMDGELQDHIVTGKKIMISSDGSPTMWHPRGYGSFAKMIRYYVNEKQMLSLEEAIHKMSGLPALTLGLKNRGTLKRGNKADLLIFNPQEIKDRATFEYPHRLADGFNWIMVNGNLARVNTEFKKGRFGKVLKRGEPDFPGHK